MRKSIIRLRPHSSRLAFTLVELMIAMAITLVLVFAIAQFYAYVGKSVSDGRAMIEMSGQLRSVNLRLRQDLNNLTVQVKPPVEPGAAQGYLEIVESSLDIDGDGLFDRSGAYDGDPDASSVHPTLGTFNYLGPDANGNTYDDLTEDVNTNQVADMIEGPDAISSMIGDGDDVLAMTVMSRAEPFQARFNMIDPTNPANIITVSRESMQAEVVWFTGFKDLDANGFWSRGEPRYLIRRALPIVTLPANQQLPLVAAAPRYFQDNDISVRVQFDSMAGANRWVPNTLADLTQPENRFTRQNFTGSPMAAAGQNMPNPCLLRPYNLASLSMYSLQNDRYGEDIVMQSLLAFDVRVWDPAAPILANAAPAAATTALTPSDPGFVAAALNSNAILGRGAYVDLGYGQNLIQADTSGNIVTWMNNNNGRGLFGMFPNTVVAGAPANSTILMANSSFPYYGATYDTWTTSYERDGVNQWPAITANGTDAQVNGLDDDSANGVDDLGERETQAPYPYPLRGIQVRIRMYEPASRQAKQVTVGMDFMEE